MVTWTASCYLPGCRSCHLSHWDYSRTARSRMIDLFKKHAVQNLMHDTVATVPTSLVARQHDRLTAHIRSLDGQHRRRRYWRFDSCDRPATAWTQGHRKLIMRVEIDCYLTVHSSCTRLLQAQTKLEQQSTLPLMRIVSC